MNMVGCVFRMECGADVQVAMPDPNARVIINQWQQGTLPKFVGNSTDPYPWMVLAEKIQVIQVVPIQGMVPEEANVIPNKIPTSGVQNK